MNDPQPDVEEVVENTPQIELSVEAEQRTKSATRSEPHQDEATNRMIHSNDRKSEDDHRGCKEERWQEPEESDRIRPGNDQRRGIACQRGVETAFGQVG